MNFRFNYFPTVFSALSPERIHLGTFWRVCSSSPPGAETSFYDTCCRYSVVLDYGMVHFISAQTGQMKYSNAIRTIPKWSSTFQPQSSHGTVSTDDGRTVGSMAVLVLIVIIPSKQSAPQPEINALVRDNSQLPLSSTYYQLLFATVFSNKTKSYQKPQIQHCTASSFSIKNYCYCLWYTSNHSSKGWKVQADSIFKLILLRCDAVSNCHSTIIKLFVFTQWLIICYRTNWAARHLNKTSLID